MSKNMADQQRAQRLPVRRMVIAAIRRATSPFFTNSTSLTTKMKKLFQQ
jgi:hypothetical protein